jgi:hypothetical protein
MDDCNIIENERSRFSEGLANDRGGVVGVKFEADVEDPLFATLGCLAGVGTIDGFARGVIKELGGIPAAVDGVASVNGESVSGDMDEGGVATVGTVPDGVGTSSGVGDVCTQFSHKSNAAQS